MSVLIADFTNAARDRTFDGAVEGALAIALEGASFITVVFTDDARKIANDLVKRPAIDEAAARLVAAREGIEVILAGTISADKGGYRITVRGGASRRRHVVDAAEHRVSRADVLGAVADGRIGHPQRPRRHRVPSGAGLPTRSRSRPARSRHFRATRRRRNRTAVGKFGDAVRRSRRRSRQDANFGRAYAGLANALFYLGRKPEAEQNWKKALSLMDRMTEREKYRTQGTYFFAVTQNYEKAIDNYETLIKHYPTDSSGLNNLASCLLHGARFSQGARSRPSGAGAVSEERPVPEQLRAVRDVRRAISRPHSGNPSRS